MVGFEIAVVGELDGVFDVGECVSSVGVMVLDGDADGDSVPF